MGDRIPIGVFYKGEAPLYHDMVDVLRDGPALVDKELNPKDAAKFLNQFR